jgi:hypothetical protein
MAVTMNGTTNGSSNGNGHVKPAKLKVAILGCGRMSQRHAHNVSRWRSLKSHIESLQIFHLTPRASLVAVADPSPAAKTWVQENLDGVQCVQLPANSLKFETNCLTGWI